MAGGAHVYVDIVTRNVNVSLLWYVYAGRNGMCHLHFFVLHKQLTFYPPNVFVLCLSCFVTASFVTDIELCIELAR